MDAGTILLIAAVFITILAIKTLLPNTGASKRNIAGYKSACSFSPVSTLILLWIAVLILIIRARPANSIGIDRTPALSAGFSVVFLCAILYYSYRYVKSRSGTKHKNKDGQS